MAKSSQRRGSRAHSKVSISNKVSINTNSGSNGKSLSRRSSHVDGLGMHPEIVVDSPPPEESLYPSLTTLGSFDEEEDKEFSCRDCCKSACSHLFNFTIASCLYMTCQRGRSARHHRLESNVSIEDMEIHEMKQSLQFHFMNPFQKWRYAKRRRFPWKLFVQILNIMLVTLQLILFANTKLPLTHYIETNHKTFVNLFIEDPAPPTMYEPIPSPISTLYTIEDLYSQLNYTSFMYCRLLNQAVGPYGYQWENDDVGEFTDSRNLTLKVETYINATIDPGNKVVKIDDDNLNETVFSIDENFTATFADATDMRIKLNLDSVRRMTMEFDLSSIYISEHMRPKCFEFNIVISIENELSSGNMPVYLTLDTRQSLCKNHTDDIIAGNSGLYNNVGLAVLDIFVSIFATISTILYLRSLVKSAHFARIVRAFFLQKFNYKLRWQHTLPLFNMWFVTVILGNSLATVGSLMKLILMYRPINSIFINDVTSIIVGLAVFAQWCGILRFLSYFDKYNMLLLTLRLSMPSVLRFFVCAGILYFAFLFCGWLVLGSYHPKFIDPSTTSENLFALLNGDDIYNTYQEMSKMSQAAWIFSKVYLYTFISLFIYVVLSVFISLISDTYETLHEHWAVRSKGLLRDFAFGQLSRVCKARQRAYSGGMDSDNEQENEDYDRIREIAEVPSPKYGSTQEARPLLSPRGAVFTVGGPLHHSAQVPRPHPCASSSEVSTRDMEQVQRQRSNSHT